MKKHIKKEEKKIEKQILKIERLANDGEGIAYTKAKKPIFVYGALPGETIEAQVFVNNRNALEANILKVVEKSKYRVENEYKQEEKLGLTLDHLDYFQTLLYKKNKISFLFNTKVKKETKDTQILNIEPSELEYFYRNETTVRTKDVDGKMFWGLYKKNSNILLTTTKLITQRKEINEILNRICKILSNLGFTSFDPKTKQGIVKALSIRSSLDNEFLFTLIVDKKIETEKLVEKLKYTLPEIKTFGIVHNQKEGKNILDGNYKLIYGDYFFKFNFLNHIYYLTYNSFFQMNYETTKKMIEYIKSFNIWNKGQKLLDAYSGCGLFGLELSEKVDDVFSLEIVKDAILSNKRTLKVNNIENVHPTVGDVVSWTNYTKQEFDVMLFDPPRLGLGEKVCNFIINKEPKYVIYVSCEVETLVKDIKILSKKYNVVSVKGFDMFPHTAHVETVTLLERKDK